MTIVQPKTHTQNYTKRHPPELPNMIGDKPSIIYNMQYLYLCGKKQRKDNQALISSKNGEQWANLRTVVKKRCVGVAIP